MLGRDGQIILISFLSSIATQLLVLYYFSLDVATLNNCAIVFSVAFILHVVIMLVILIKTEFPMNIAGLLIAQPLQ